MGEVGTEAFSNPHQNPPKYIGNLQWEIHHNKAHILWPRTGVSWDYSEILCNKKSWMNNYKFIIMSFQLSVAANTFDLPTLDPVHFCMKHVIPCWDDLHHRWGKKFSHCPSMAQSPQIRYLTSSPHPLTQNSANTCGASHKPWGRPCVCPQSN